MNPRALKTLRRHKSAMAGLAVLALFVAAALLVGVVSPYDARAVVEGVERQPPTASHWLGTDHHGRDTLTRLAYGARYSLGIGLAAVALSLAVGVPLGLFAGYFTGWTDASISRAMDVVLSMPSLLLAIVITSAVGAGMASVVLAVGVVGIPQFARQVRASVIELKELDYVTAARALGAGHLRILFREILPNAVGPIIVLATLGLGSAILTAAGLSFLGLGVETDTAEWGAMLHDGRKDFRDSAWQAVFSGAAITLAVLAFNLFGDGLRDALDPRSKSE